MFDPESWELVEEVAQESATVTHDDLRAMAACMIKLRAEVKALRRQLMSPDQSIQEVAT